jgi:ribulose-bisphosphate carboxylase large chain
MTIIKNKYDISADRFLVSYLLTGDRNEAYAKAQDICLEQTVEFPGDLLPEGIITDEIVGRIESFDDQTEGSYRAVISYNVDIAACELTQLLNVIFGNISIKPGIIVERLDLPQSLLDQYKGPRFGQQGLRERLGIHGRPLLSTALKPMGLSAKGLAEYAYKFALGGVDIIKDDHGLSNQRFAPFDERVKYCAEAVERANLETGGKSVYAPNITAPYGEVMKRAYAAKRFGAGALLISPGLTGYDVMREIADTEDIALPVISHPAFLGSFVNGTNGFSHYAMFGQIARLAGADATIYPNYGGRFSFSKEECESIVAGATVDMGHIKTVFPTPGGGMTFESVPGMLRVYGNDVIFLIGGGLFRHGPDLVENARYFSSMIR